MVGYPDYTSFPGVLFEFRHRVLCDLSNMCCFIPNNILSGDHDLFKVKYKDTKPENIYTTYLRTSSFPATGHLLVRKIHHHIKITIIFILFQIVFYRPIFFFLNYASFMHFVFRTIRMFGIFRSFPFGPPGRV